MQDRFLTEVQGCALCGIEVEAGSPHVLAGVRVCAGCAGGDLDRAIARNGLTCEVRVVRMDRQVSRRVVEVTRPTHLDLAVTFEPRIWRGLWRRLLGAKGPEDGERSFDELVRVRPADEGFTELALSALRDDRVRQAILELAYLGCAVELAGRTVWARARSAGLLFPFPEFPVLRPLAVALAVAVERFARGAKL